MKEMPTAEEIKITENFLKSYKLNQRLLRLDKYEREFFGERYLERETEGFTEARLARPRMFDVRHFIMSLPNSDEKLLLYCHYVRGQSIEACAELLGISRSSAFRKKKAALRLATEKYISERGAQSNFTFNTQNVNKFGSAVV